MNINNLIKKSLEYYDKQQTNNKQYWYNAYIDHKNKGSIIKILDKDDDTIKLESTYEILGIFENQTKIWIWAWLIPYLNQSETTISRKLLDYGLKLDPPSNTSDHLYIKSQLLNSRILIEDNIELDIHLALASYLVKDMFSFIMPFRYYHNVEKTKYSTIYYLIK